MSKAENTEAKGEATPDTEAKAKKVVVRRTTDSLLNSEVVNERFAGVVRKMSDTLRKSDKVDTSKMTTEELNKYEEKIEATDKLYRVKTAAIVKGIIATKKDLLFADVKGQPKNELVPKVKAVILDLAHENEDGTRGRKTVEMENFYKELVAIFKVEKPAQEKTFITKDFKLF